MPATIEQLGRSGELKRRLVEFAQTRRFERELRRAFARRRVDTDFGAVTVTDRFVLQHRLEGGRTVVEHFVGAHPDLPEDDRAMLLGWQDVVEGLFEIEGRDGEALVTLNLVDELTYRIRSNKGPSMFG
jgi:hypothetical protein